MATWSMALLDGARLDLRNTVAATTGLGTGLGLVAIRTRWRTIEEMTTNRQGASCWKRPGKRSKHGGFGYSAPQVELKSSSKSRRSWMPTDPLKSKSQQMGATQVPSSRLASGW